MHLSVISVFFIFISTICALPQHNTLNVHQYAPGVGQKPEQLSFHIAFKNFYGLGYHSLGSPPDKLDKLSSQAIDPSMLETLWEKYRQKSIAGIWNDWKAYPLIVHVNDEPVVIKMIASSKVEDVIFEIHGFERIGALVAWAGIGRARFGLNPRYLIVLKCDGCVPASNTHLSASELKALRSYARAKILLKDHLLVSEDSGNYAYQPAKHRDEHAIASWQACYLGRLTRKSQAK